jgi:hypothetical protein
MRVLMATEPGAVDRPNEDFAVVVPGAAVLLDGAGLPPTQETGCVHGTAWYVRRLGGLLAGGVGDRTTPLRELLRQGIERVSEMHAGTCDLSCSATPQTTVIIVRQLGEMLDYLVLCDSVLLFQPRDGEPRAITDTRLGDHLDTLRPAPGLVAGTPEHDAARRAYSQQVRAARNQPGGFWLAAADPAAADEALTGREPIAGLTAVALLSDGATRIADRFHLVTWAQIFAILASDGPAGLIREVRAAEASDPQGLLWPRGKIHDDATAVYWPTGS